MVDPRQTDLVRRALDLIGTTEPLTPEPTKIEMPPDVPVTNEMIGGKRLTSRRFHDRQYVFVEGPKRRGVIVGEPENETMLDGSTARWYVVAFEDGSVSYTHESRLRDTTEGKRA
jgi:hypothetical protein